MASNPNDRRIIEVEMPLTKISEHSAREKSIRHGHLSTLHIWWARRPLAACRAAIFAALVPQPQDSKEAKKMQNFIASLADWDNSIDNSSPTSSKGIHHYIKDARAYIKQAFPDRAPRVLDPFSGGGAIPLEALRLGCETYAFDLNPVAHIIQLATLVYPQKYAHRPGNYGEKPGATLIGDVKRWGKWILDKAEAEIGGLYPTDKDGSTPIAYLWARTITCPRTDCGVQVPLIRSTWLVRKSSKNVAYRIVTDGPGNTVQYKIVGPVSEQKALGFDPTKGTTLRGVANCPACNTPLSEKYIKLESKSHRLDATLFAIVTDTPGQTGKRYREVNATDNDLFRHAKEISSRLTAQYDPLNGELSPIPDEALVDNDMKNIWVPLYGLDTVGKLYNARQALAVATFARITRDAYAGIVAETGDTEYAKAIATYLAITVDRLADSNSSLARWRPTVEAQANTFSRQALAMMWDYVEINPFGGSSGDWGSCLEWVWKYIEHGAASANNPADVRRGTATKLPYSDQFFDAIITDPPYYNNIAYSELSDFFYAWLKRTAGDFHPTILGAPVSPKEQEIVEGGTLKRSKAWFEAELARAFSECARVLRDDGICVVVYAHKAISAWESLVGSLIHSGLSVEGSWPFNTERGARLIGQGTAALASSIFLVCRKRKVDAGVGIAGDVRVAIEANVRERLDQFWAAGLRGADFFISAIGPATAAFSRYDRVQDLRGNEITVSTLLEWVQQTVADYALRRVFAAATQDQDEGSEGLGVVDDETRFYVLWRWTYDSAASVVGATGENGNGGKKKTGPLSLPADTDDTGDESDFDEGSSASGGKADKKKKIPFGDAHLMATALGSDINALIHRFQILEGKSDVLLLSAAERNERMADFGERRADGSRPPLIDVLHRCELLWAANMSDELADYLSEFAPDDREALRRVAQALIDVLPRGDLEKQRLEGFLYSGVAQQSSDAPRPGATIQQGLGEDFGTTGKVLRDKRKGYGRK